MGDNLSQMLEPIAAIFRNMNLPDAITHWGHPFFMSIVMFFMGGYAVYTGWKGRLLTATEPAQAAELKATHKKAIAAAFLFMAIGYTGGLLSLVIQQKPLLESPHFLTGSLLLIFLAANMAISTFGFGGDRGKELRKVHAIFGSGIFGVMVLHGILGIQLGLK
jgi:hypothetical protein